MSEWYSCRWDCPAVYDCRVKLIREGNSSHEFPAQDLFELRENLEGNKQNEWFRVSSFRISSIVLRSLYIVFFPYMFHCTGFTCIRELWTRSEEN